MKSSLLPHAAAVAPIEARASGKAIIVGEHAVVYGARAVAMPLKEMRMRVRLTRTDDLTATGEPLIRVQLQGKSVNEHLRGVIADAFQVLNAKPFGLDVDAQSSILIGAGLGSSASLCVVILRALAEALDRRLEGSELAELGNRLEKRFHGNPSGMDTAVVAHEQVITFAKGQGAAAQPVKGRWRFALLDSGARSSTLAMIQIAAPYFQGALGPDRIAAFDRLAGQVALALAEGNQVVVAGAMNQASAWLDDAGVVNAPLQKMIDLALDLGCPAAKPTGSGGGGCVLALLGLDHAAEQLANLKERLGPTRVFGVEIPS